MLATLEASFSGQLADLSGNRDEADRQAEAWTELSAKWKSDLTLQEGNQPPLQGAQPRTKSKSVKLLDTDTCVAILRGNSAVMERRRQAPDRVATTWRAVQVENWTQVIFRPTRCRLSYSSETSNSLPHFLPVPLLDRREDIGDDLGPWLGAEVAFAVHADADGAGFQVAVADDEHGVDLHLLGALDLAVDLVGAESRVRRGPRARAVRHGSPCA